MSKNWKVKEYRQSQTDEVVYYIVKCPDNIWYNDRVFLHKDGTIHAWISITPHRYLCEAPGYWRTRTDAQAFLNKWLEKNSRPKPKHGDVVEFEGKRRIIIDCGAGLVAYNFCGYVISQKTVRQLYRTGDYKVIGNVFEGFCQ